MVSLADISDDTRKFLKYGGIGLGALIILFIGIKTVGLIINVLFPKPAPPPEQKFGKLPGIQFPNTSGQQDITYSLNTITGALPNFPDRLPVYKFTQNEPSLLALQNVREILSPLGYTLNETQLSNTLFQWSNPDGSLIQYDIVNNNFKISSNYLYTTASQSAYSFPDTSQIIEYPLTYLGKINEDTSDVDSSLTQVSYYNIGGNQLVPTENPSTAQVARVDMYQNNVPVDPFTPFQDQVTDLPIFYANPGKSSLYFLLEPLNFDLKVVEAQFNHQTINLENTDAFSTYYIKTAQQAFNDLKSGNAYIINTGTAKTVQINDIELGYYAGDGTNEYLMPIVVFKGDGFTAYVNAIPTSSIGN
jgi:hypothetical protein